MKQANITTKVFSGKGDARECVREIELTWHVPGDQEEMVESWGQEVVYSLAIEAATVKAQSIIRQGLERSIKNGRDRLTDQEVREVFPEDWKPQIGRQVDPKVQEAKVDRGLEGLSQEARKRLFEKYVAQLETRENKNKGK